MAEMAGSADLDGLKQEVSNRSDPHKDKRESERRKSPRRAYDLLRDILAEEERWQFDKVLWQTHRLTDRRAKARRLGGDRRKG